MYTAYYPLIAVYSSPMAAVPYSTVKRVAEACALQQYYDFRPYWGNYGVVQAYQYPYQVPSYAWHCALMHRNEDVLSRDHGYGGGYHDSGPYNNSTNIPGSYKIPTTNQPWAFVNAEHVTPGGTGQASHEILEMMVQPYPSDPQRTNRVARWVWSPDGCTYWTTPKCPGLRTSKWVSGVWGMEVADPVYNWAYTHNISSANGGGTMAVSDFVTPAWFQPTGNTAQYRPGAYAYPPVYDYLRRLTNPLSFSWWGRTENNYQDYWLQAGFLIGG